MFPQAVYLAGYCLLLASLSSAQLAPDKAHAIEAHAAQAAADLRNNRPDLAASEFSAMTAIDPDNPDAQSNLGVLLFFQGDFRQAAGPLGSALKLNPGAWRIQALLGMCEKRNGDMKPAEHDLGESLPHLQDEKVKLRAGMELAEIYYDAGELGKAAGILPLLSSLRPEDPNVLYLAYRIYSELARESAIGLAMSAPNSARVQQVTAEALAREGRYADAIAHFREALKTDPDLPGAHFELGEMLSVSGNAAAAEAEYRSALAVNPADAKSESRLGQLALRATDMKRASGHFAAALRLQPDDVDTCVGMAKVYIAENQPEKALPLLERASKSEPLDSAIHYQLGLVYKSMGRTAESHDELAEFARLKDSNARLKQVFRQMGLQPKPGRPEQDGDSPSRP